MRLFSILMLIAAPAISIGCSQPADTPAVSEEVVLTTVNTHCPIMGSKVTPDGGSVTWNDQTIGFCCPECIETWEGLSDEEKQSKLAEADHDHADGDHDHDAHDQEESS